MFTILLLFSAVLCSNVQAEIKIRKGVKYTTEAESDLTPDQLLVWMERNPVRPVAKGVEKGIYGKKNVMFMIFDVKGSDNNILQIGIVRILTHKNLSNIEDPLVLIGYTIMYVDGSIKSYKWNINSDVYEEYDFLRKRFKNEELNIPDVEEQSTNRKQLVSN